MKPKAPSFSFSLCKFSANAEDDQSVDIYKKRNIIFKHIYFSFRQNKCIQFSESSKFDLLLLKRVAQSDITHPCKQATYGISQNLSLLPEELIQVALYPVSVDGCSYLPAHTLQPKLISFK